VEQLAVLGCVDMDVVEEELEEGWDLVAFSLIIPGSYKN
jgi:hypothetical protein